MTDEKHTETVDEERRDFIHIAAGAAVVGGGGMLAWPFIASLTPARDTKAASSLEVPVTDIEEGSEIRVLIGGRPFFIRHRTAKEIAEAEAVNVSSLREKQTDEERLRPLPNGQLKPEILIVSGSCTHLGCVPVGPGSNTGEFGGWYCPCHGSHYDTSGRIRKGPAPSNLPVPDYEYNADGTAVTISL